MTAAPTSVGWRALAAADPVQGARVPVHLLYPAHGVPRAVTFGAYALELAADAPAIGDALPVVAISHGTGSTPWALRELACRLARAGFAVALVEHPGNSRADNALAGTPENLVNRPRHVRLALDAAFADPVVGPRLATTGASVIGHSLGGYTALAIAGGHPTALPAETVERVGRLLAIDPDPRVDAVALLAPALPWFLPPGALADVHARVFVRTGEHDELAPPAFVASILRGLPTGARVDHQIVSGAGHFAFLAPFPPALVAPGFAPAHDPPGFDRAGYQRVLADEVIAFLRAG